LPKLIVSVLFAPLEIDPGEKDSATVGGTEAD
jgi:hypothetical protein